MSTIAVIVATFGDHKWAERAEHHALASIEHQTSRPDETFAVHDSCAALHEVRNYAGERAESDWLCFLDADDRLDAFYIEAMRAAIDASDGDRLLTPSVERGGRVGLIPPRESIWHGNWLVIGTLIPRALFLECEGFWDERGWEDWSLWIRAVELGANPIAVPGAIYQAGPSSGRNTVVRPFALGLEIRQRNLAWLGPRLTHASWPADAIAMDRTGLAKEAV